MFKTTADLLIKSHPLRVVQGRFFAAAVAEPKSEDRLQSFRTFEADPSKHNTNHQSQFYKVDSTDKKVLFQYGGLPKSFQIQAKTFNETCLMVRDPSIQIINHLKTIDYTQPPIKFVLYGKKGCGKTLTLAHIMHYAYKNDFLIVHVPWVGNWMRRCKDTSNSETKPGFIDLNIDAAAWLVHFKTQNANILENPELKTTIDIQWNKRECTPIGSSLLELIDQGINRIRFASNCVNYLAEEVKKLSQSGLCRTLLAIDGFNAFFYPNTRVFTEKKEMVPPSRVTLTEGFLNLTKFDWKNSVIVVTVDEIAIAEKDQISHYPRYLLGKSGFEHLDPFLPVEVKDYSEKEHQSIMDYYRERKWIHSYPGQNDELYFLSGGNPFRLMNLCNAL
ncbi:unnamed protein product [Ceutorhynchus assimilis]|uniref:Small ribosomal subunit protein mS29 n=1 Tax=Ceutorhynchus assimilis TaxID=467358 RepID=A0A9N9MFL5_9CUCU|nr:unnamed protein product [Ceutorhynchus assimilis]